jgi:hypothetical protein
MVSKNKSLIHVLDWQELEHVGSGHIGDNKDKSCLEKETSDKAIVTTQQQYSNAAIGCSSSFPNHCTTTITVVAIDCCR